MGTSLPLYCVGILLSCYLSVSNVTKTQKKKRTIILKWAAIYFSIATLAIIYPLITEFRLIFFGLAMVPFFLINMYFSWQKNDRALMNDFVAILVFAIGGLTSYFYGTGSLNETAWELFGHSIIYFVGTAFFVKTMIREKRNVRYKIASWTYHVGLIPVFLILTSPLIFVSLHTKHRTVHLAIR